MVEVLVARVHTMLVVVLAVVSSPVNNGWLHSMHVDIQCVLTAVNAMRWAIGTCQTQSFVRANEYKKEATYTAPHCITTYFVLLSGSKNTLMLPSPHPTMIWLSLMCHRQLTTLCRAKHFIRRVNQGSTQLKISAALWVTCTSVPRLKLFWTSPKFTQQSN